MPFYVIRQQANYGSSDGFSILNSVKSENIGEFPTEEEARSFADKETKLWGKEASTFDGGTEISFYVSDKPVDSERRIRYRTT